MKMLLSLLVFCFISTKLSAQILDFYKEYITVEIHPGYVEINGVYQLRNNEEHVLEMNMYYPFSIDSMYGKVSNVYAFETENDSSVNKLIDLGGKGALIKLEVESKSEKTLYIGYEQELNGNKAEYILTSTKKWGKPLESSQIELIVPKNYLIENITYQPFDTIVSGKKVHYFVQEVDFLPEKNFVVWFKILE